MKKTILLLSIAFVAFIGCNKEDDGRLDANAKIYINADKSVTRVYESTNPDYLSAREVVKQAILLCNTYGEMGIGDWNRDTINNRIIGSSTWVVAQNGTLEIGFISSRDNILVTLDDRLHVVDTIAYVPNSIMIELEPKVTESYNNEDYATCYSLFDKSYIFRPINGAVYLELQKENKH